MPEIRVETNADEVIAKLKLNAEKASLASRRIVERSAVVIASEARRQFLGSAEASNPNEKKLAKKGLPYANGRSQSWPRPTQRTGGGKSVRDSIIMRNLRPSGSGWAAEVGPDEGTHPYARRLEFGGRSTHSMAFGRPTAFSWHVTTRPFPYMKPGLLRAEPEVQAIYREEWERALK